LKVNFVFLKFSILEIYFPIFLKILALLAVQNVRKKKKKVKKLVCLFGLHRCRSA